MNNPCTFEEFKKSVSDFLHDSMTADLSALENGFTVIRSMYQNITPVPQGTLKIVVASTWNFVEREYNKCASKSMLKNLSI